MPELCSTAATPPIILMGQRLLRAPDYKVVSRPYIVKGLLLASQVSLLVGPPNIGKSSVIAAICAHVSMGRTIGRQRVSRAAVLYVAAEDADGIAERAAGFWGHDEGESAKLYILAHAVNLTDDAQMNVFLAEAKRFLTATGADQLMVVFDTLNLCLGDGDENSARDMSRAIGNAQRLARETRAHVLIVHHTSAADAAKPRGSTAMQGNADTVLVLRQTDDASAKIVVLTQEKQRSQQKGKPLAFELRPFDVGVDTDGETITVPMAAPLNAAPAELQRLLLAQKDGPSPREIEVLRILTDLAKPGLDINATSKEIVSRVGKPFDDARANPNSLSRAVRRTLDSLLSRGMITNNEEGGFALVPADGPAHLPR